MSSLYRFARIWSLPLHIALGSLGAGFVWVLAAAGGLTQRASSKSDQVAGLSPISRNVSQGTVNVVAAFRHSHGAWSL